MKTPENAMQALSKSFSPDQVKQRQGGMNRQTGKPEIYNYVTAETVLARLREVFGIDFDMDVPGLENGLDRFVITAGNKTEVVVPVRLTYMGTDGERHSVVGFGSKDLKGTDIGDSFKAAQSKAAKSAAKALGVPIDGGEQDDDSEEEIAEPAKPNRPAKPEGAAGGPNKPAKPAAKPNKPAPKEDLAPSDDDETDDADEEEAAEPEKPAAKPNKPGKPSKPEPKEEAATAADDEGEYDGVTFKLNADGEPLCTECGDAVQEMEDDDGELHTVEKLLELAINEMGYKRPICAGCISEMDEE
jgi:Rad52/22 family double-strand break repair protein/Cobaltochelatase CobS subunit N terminal